MGRFTREGEVPSDIDVKTVSWVSQTVRKLLDNPGLRNIWVIGEIRDFRPHAKGHIYFSLSEKAGTSTYVINCAMWRSSAVELSFQPKDGMKVLVWGSIEVYEPHGKYQLIARDMHRAGEGDKHLLVQRWKDELTAEGLFDPARKRPLPPYPVQVGIVTSPTGAARHDIEQVIARRYPLDIVISPTAVQGEAAHHEIAEAIRRLDGLVDVIIVGRGGGSFEDLFPFNHPDVVRAIAGCMTPIVTAIGHEVDVTLADFAADFRAPTPSAAAELVVPDRRELNLDLSRWGERMDIAVSKKFERAFEMIEELRLRLMPQRFLRRLDEEIQRLIDIEDRLARGILASIERENLKIGHLKLKLDAASPLHPLERGYCIVEKSGSAISTILQVRSGDRVTIRFFDGDALVRVEEIHHGKKI